MNKTHLKLYQTYCHGFGAKGAIHMSGDPKKVTKLKALSKRITDSEVFKSILAFLEIRMNMRMQACYKRWYDDAVPDAMSGYPILNFRLTALIESNPLVDDLRFKFEFEALMPAPL